VIATVIPVLFLAIAVQGTAYDQLLGFAKSAAGTRLPGYRRTGIRLAMDSVLIALVIVGFTGIGEILSLFSLASRRALAGAEFWSLGAAIILTGAIVSRPFGAAIRSIPAIFREDWHAVEGEYERDPPHGPDPPANPPREHGGNPP
jgi:hypothetical protein